jgi:dTDP-4-dehydrorhamnose reductase
MKRMLITGASGFLGWNLCQRTKGEWNVMGTYFSHPVEVPGVIMSRVDLTDYRTLKHLIKGFQPHAVIHLAAVSDANFCQDNPALSKRINAEASINLAGLCSDFNIQLLFTSSDLIFDGRHAPYSEGDEPYPVSAYGEQKVMAEKGMKDRYPRTVLCRVPLMFGKPGPAGVSFLQPMVRALKAGDTLNLFVDEFRCPLSGRDAAEGLMIALDQQIYFSKLHAALSQSDHFGRRGTLRTRGLAQFWAVL